MCFWKLLIFLVKKSFKIIIKFLYLDGILFELYLDPVIFNINDNIFNEMLELEKQVTDEKILTDFAPKGRKPSATGGRVRAASGGLADILKL